jgi:hypothetical protein
MCTQLHAARRISAELATVNYATKPYVLSVPPIPPGNHREAVRMYTQAIAGDATDRALFSNRRFIGTLHPQL